MLDFCFYVLGLGVIILFFLLCSSLRMKTPFNKEKSRPFECGFDPTAPRVQFCIKFFLVCIIFLIFDVEVTLVIPLPFSQTFLILFIVILVLGLVYEWYYGGLEWIV